MKKFLYTAAVCLLAACRFPGHHMAPRNSRPEKLTPAYPHSPSGQAMRMRQMRKARQKAKRKLRRKKLNRRRSITPSTVSFCGRRFW